MNRATRWGALATLGAIVAAVITDLTISEVGAWWNGHSLIGSFVTSVLILAVTVQVVDQVAARRRVKERERVSAVQALIVYGQALRTERVLLTPPNEREGDNPANEMQALGSMVLTAAPALFDDPTARSFMEKVERYTSVLYQTVRDKPGSQATDAEQSKLTKAKKELTTAVQPLLGRLNPRDVATIEDEALD